MARQPADTGQADAFNIPSKYWDIFNESPGGVSIATDPLCKKILHNRKASRMLRVSSGGDFFHSSVHPPKVTVYRNRTELSAGEMPMQRSGRRKADVLDEVLEFVREDGHRMISVWNTAPILNGEGDALGVLAVSEDITDFVLQERRMQADKEFFENLAAERKEEQAKLRIELERLDRLNLIGTLDGAKPGAAPA
ncbi:hypothetical protein SAMN02799624_05593 [Paenibacillus sp. UNC496MF]|uniref:hypothetical protein n=1 Tax=Paenibacillus sp. UNC496MF TaxID=1502753 RepID=UPI0008EA6797|nr:hypothetical protein [Paenibacillus sp. UNC496MF]SFJ70555.1 hypothetical protein SAMN02799624_05593 [Paenibacillus sp. UNC496MF]